MTSPGMRVELAVDSADACPVAGLSKRTDGVVSDVVRSRPESTDEPITEFTVADAEAAETETEPIEQVFATERGGRYRLKPGCEHCPCDTIEDTACPVAEVRAVDGRLLFTLYVPDIAHVQDIVADLQEAFDGVSLRSLQQSGDLNGSDAVLVDRGVLTDRQREVLERAHEMGYFEYPKGANASDVAEALDITVSTFAEHLAAAQSKLFEAIVEA